MKIYLAMAAILFSVNSFSAEEVQVGKLKNEYLNRVYDPQYGIVCYSTHFSSLSCVKVDKPEQKPKATNRSEDVPE